MVCQHYGVAHFWQQDGQLLIYWIVLSQQDALRWGDLVPKFVERGGDIFDALRTVYQQPEGQRQISFMGKIANSLRLPVFFQGEITLIQIGDDLAMFVPYRGKDVDDFHFYGNGRNRRRLGVRIAGFDGGR